MNKYRPSRSYAILKLVYLMVPLWLKVYVCRPTLDEELSSYKLAHVTLGRQLLTYQACRHESCDDSRRGVSKRTSRLLQTPAGPDQGARLVLTI